MATLSKVSDLTRKIAEIGGIGIAAIVLLFVLFKVGAFVKELIAPTPLPAPTVAFGKIALVSFPQNLDNKNYSYTVNTLSGSLPTLPDRMNVYKLQQPTPNLLGLDKAKDIAAAGGFANTPIALSDTAYRWTKTDPLPSTLDMDIQSFDFTLTSQYRNDTTVTDAANMPDEATARTFSKTFFDKFMPLPNSIDDNKTKTTLLSIGPGGLQPASSLSNAQVIRVDYFPKDIDKIPVFGVNPAESLIYSLIASGVTDFPQLIEAQYYHRSTTSDKATYPIKSASQAFAELKDGKGYIAANPTGETNITITDVTLGYFIDPTSQQYLWPIIVFQGNKGFYAYIAALTDEWVRK